MPNSPDARARRTPPGRLQRLRRAFERFAPLPEPRRRMEARRAFESDPAFLSELLRILERAKAPDLFLAPPSTRRGERLADSEPDAEPGRLFGGRWRLVRRIGKGGQGVVWEARDSVTRGLAAVKLLRRPRDRRLETFSRESAAMRWLRLPGVVRILDDGRDRGVFWIAMEHVDGRPFPGPGRAGDWTKLEPVVLGLLEALARIHGAGVVHGDLKPHNVLVDARGTVVVLDLGLAAAVSQGGRDKSFGGTPGYVAPERARGAASDARSDLYSAGAMIRDALRGRAPARVRRVVARMLKTDRAQRPESAAEALRLLRPPSPPPSGPRWTERALRARFRGHDWFHHLREDAAHELFRRTRGEPAAVEEELAAWMRAGIARLEGGLVDVERVALDRLRASPGAGPVRAHATKAGVAVGSGLAAALRSGDKKKIVRAAMDVGRDALSKGLGVRALSAMELGAYAAAGRELEAALVLAATAALSIAVPREIDRALWLVERFGSDDAFGTGLRDSLRAASAILVGDVRLAQRLSRGASRRAPPSVQPIAWSVRALVAQSLDLDVQRRTVAEAARWARRADTAAARRAFRTWKAWLLYREGRCGEAAAMHLANARAARSRSEQMRSLVDAAVSALDAGDEARAVELANAARRRAAALRHPVREARAYFTMREARMRRGASLRTNLPALAAVDDLGLGALRWNSRMTESVIAWKRGDLDCARQILAPLGGGRAPGGLALYELPVACLAVALGAPLTSGSPDALARRIVREAAPALAAQCLALLSLAPAADRPALRRRLSALRLPSRGAEFTRAREFLSVEDAVALLLRR